jgi:hypothetical protein
MNKQYLLTGLVFLITNINVSAQKISDEELKTNMTDISSALGNIVKLEPKTFDYRSKKGKLLQLPAGRQYGFLSANIDSVFPGIVRSENKSYTFGKNNTRTVSIANISTESLIPVLVASIKELKSEIDLLKQEVEQLKKSR